MAETTKTMVRRCDCGRPIYSKFTPACGRCTKARIRAASTGHTYGRTHVHVWPSGDKTIELGTRCDGTDHRQGNQA